MFKFDNIISLTDLVIVCVPESVDDSLCVVVQDFVVESFRRVAGIDPQGGGCVEERHLRSVILKLKKQKE